MLLCAVSQELLSASSVDLSHLITAPRLGVHAISAAVERSGVDKKDIEEAFMGNVVSSGVGQAPARQAVIYAGLQLGTKVNKVCANGMKTVMLSSLAISSGYRDVVIAGGMESEQNLFSRPRELYLLTIGKACVGQSWSGQMRQETGMPGGAAAACWHQPLWQVPLASEPG